MTSYFTPMTSLLATIITIMMTSPYPTSIPILSKIEPQIPKLEPENLRKIAKMGVVHPVGGAY